MKPDQLLDTHSLHTFVTIAEANSLTDAARRLGITQSAVSQCLKQLEQQLGAPLVARRTKPVKLTVAGYVLKQQAETILGDLRRLHSHVRYAAEQNLVQCRVGLVTSCSEVFGSKLLAQLSQQADQLTLKSGLTASLKEAFVDREIDVMISNDPLNDIPGLVRFPLFRDPMLLAIPRGWIGDTPPPLEKLAADYPLIRFNRSTHIGAFAEVVLRRLRVVTTVRYETDDSHALMSFVRDGHGWAVLSGLCLAQVFYRLQGVRILELGKSRHARNLYLVARAEELGDIPARIAETLKQIFEQHTFPELQQQIPWLSPDMFHCTEE